MTILVRSGQAGAGAGPVTYQDPLTSGSPFMGLNWDVQVTFRSSSMVGTVLDGAVNASVAGMTWGSAGGTGGLGTAQCFPVPIDNYNVIAISAVVGQYAQAKFVAKGGGAVSANLFITVMGSVSEVGYGIGLSTLDGGTCVLRRDTGNYAAATILDAALMTYAAGDVLRIEARPVGSTIEIRTYKNGVFNKLTVDSSASRLLQGRAGFALVTSQPAATITMADYDGGALAA